MDYGQLAKILAAAATALTMAGGGAKLGYDRRDSEISEALERCKCKYHETREYAEELGWEHPGPEWCQVMEER